MILDANAVLSSLQAITVTAVSTGVYDTAGVGVGVPAPNFFGQQGGGATIFGEDLGGGGPSSASPPQLGVQVSTAFTAGGSATLKVQLQAAVDTGTNTGTPGTWQTIVETDTLAVALLTLGTWLARFVVPDRYPGQGYPRFYRLNYVVATGPMTAGAVNAFLATGIDSPQAYQANF